MGTALLLFGFRCWRMGRLGVVMERMVGPRVLYRVVGRPGMIDMGGGAWRQRVFSWEGCSESIRWQVCNPLLFRSKAVSPKP